MAKSGILALDLATRIGWAYVPTVGDEPRSGVKQLPVGARGIGHFLDEAEQWVVSVCEVMGPETVVFEAPFVGPAGRANLDTARKLLGLACIAELVCFRKGITVYEQHNATVKKWFAGHGRADKAAMIAACRKHGWNPSDDNEADALALLAYSMALFHPGSRYARSGLVQAAAPN